MIRIKICGITNEQDALLACQLGADALGFVFYERSPRFISVQKAQAIMAKLPPFVSVVGLFVNASKPFIDEILKQLPLDIVQFHGDESALFCQSFDRPYIKAVRVQTREDILMAQHDFATARALLFDAHVKDTYGGTGQRFDWGILPEQINMPWVLSGGLTPDNVGEAVTLTHALAVDVSSSVESEKGVKCPQKLAAFFEGVHRAR
ncbi:phosphoribosylanthranilate isomerase [Neisseria sp. Ec49-e6-T10]|uniref:phosphoribosylanthranilate isomerase n=1 Tax=Neisseria sp. Ec49-e6-T10 TaxID=3140744 RepID=UPI003EBB09FB